MYLHISKVLEKVTTLIFFLRKLRKDVMMKNRSPRRKTQNSGERSYNDAEVRTGRCVVFPGKAQEIENCLAFIVEDCIEGLAKLLDNVDAQGIKGN